MFDVVIFFGVFFWIEPSNASFQSWRCFLTRYSPLKILVFFWSMIFLFGWEFWRHPKIYFWKNFVKNCQKIDYVFLSCFESQFSKKMSDFFERMSFWKCENVFLGNFEAKFSKKRHFWGVEDFWKWKNAFLTILRQIIKKRQFFGATGGFLKMKKRFFKYF